jgi:hypothetical protein
MRFDSINRINRGHRRKGGRGTQKIEKRVIKKPSKIRPEQVELNDSKNVYNFFSYGEKPKPRGDYCSPDEENLKDLESIGEFNESEADSKFGLSVFDLSETELGEDYCSSDYESPEDILCGMLLEEHLEAPYHSSMDDVLDRLGMHIESVEDRRKYF